ncbi:MAG: hypothetical protein JSU01_08170 [Bacteroidetes bacterium]|nr:hypothetical protein [Bacteroidota bacterium]
MEQVIKIDQKKFGRMKIISWVIFVTTMLFSAASILAVFREVDLLNGYFFFLLYALTFPFLMATIVFKPLTQANYSAAKTKIVITILAYVLPLMYFMYTLSTMADLAN